MVRDAEEWPWSNYRATAGLGSTPGWLTTEWTLAAFGRTLGQAQAAYRHFVAEGTNQPSPWGQLKNQIYLGSEAFVDRMLARASESTKVLSEIPVGQRRPLAQPLQYYFQTQPNRDKAIVEAFRTGNYTMKAIADHAGLHYSRVSRIIVATARGKTPCFALLGFRPISRRRQIHGCLTTGGYSSELAKTAFILPIPEPES